MKKPIILFIAALVAGGVLYVKSINNTKDLFESNVEVLAEIESPSGGFGSMCVTRFVAGNCRYNRCEDCDNWEMCTPVEIKYCP